MSNEKKSEGFEVVNLNEECFVVVLKKFPPKLKDLGCSTIPYTMHNSYFKKALCDLAFMDPNLLIFLCNWATKPSLIHSG
ncbi:hypothetical protein CR513_20671, partial [Mucuna pruriens]